MTSTTRSEARGRATLLVIEDEPAIADLVTAMAGPLGLDVVSSTLGAGAVALIEQHRPAVVTLDLVLPDTDGLTVLKQIRARPELRELPVVILSALQDVTTVKAAYGFGATDFIGKPFNVDLLEAKLGLFLRLHRLAEDLQAARREAQVIATAARRLNHELRNLTQSMGSSARRCAYQADPEVRLRVARLIEEEAARIAELARQYVELQEPPAPVRQVDLPALVSDVLELNLGGSPARSRIEVVVAADPPMVRGDPSRLKQLLINLLFNAVVATERQGAIVVAIRPWEAGAEIVVADTGCGIAAADLPLVFEESFSRTGSDGLGLAIVQRIVDQHRGRVAVASSVGEGTRFTIWLPAA